ncbi:MAG: hypothetical protein HYT10_00515 [Candidatus Levybacteria bacterium]|nr:hypothetical protein [Candidatus Levybacteria bacterium]
MNRLFIDAADSEHVIVRIEKNGRYFTHKSGAKQKGSQVILSAINSLLVKAGMSVKDLEEIEVVSEKGSYTGLRVAAAIGNTLSYALRIPINGKKGIFVEPTYQ